MKDYEEIDSEWSIPSNTFKNNFEKEWWYIHIYISPVLQPKLYFSNWKLVDWEIAIIPLQYGIAKIQQTTNKNNTPHFSNLLAVSKIVVFSTCFYNKITSTSKIQPSRSSPHFHTRSRYNTAIPRVIPTTEQKETNCQSSPTVIS